MPGRDLSAELFDDAQPSGARDLSADLFGSTKAGNRDIEAGRAKPAWQQGLVVGANGIGMGFADEIGGALGAVVDKVKNPSSSLKDNYLSNRDTLRGMEAAQRERAPITSMVGQAVSSLPLAIAAPWMNGARATSGAGAVAGLGQRTAQSVAVGAGHGTVAGAGNSTATDAAGLGMDSLIGGVTGATAGGVLTPVAAGVRAVGGNIASRVSEKAAGNHARIKVAEALARDARGAMATSGQVNPMGQIGRRFDRLGDEAVIADAGGRNTNQLLDTLATLPGRTKEAAANLLHRRQAGSGERMRSAADRALGTNGQRLASTVDDLMVQREAQAGPLYAQLRQTDVAPSDNLLSIVQAADKLGATKTARRIATAERVPFTLDLETPGSRWSMPSLDLVKRGLDDMIEAGQRSGNNTSVRAYVKLKKDLTNELDDMTVDPQTGQSLYKSARDAFAGPSALITAAEKGRKVIGGDEVSIKSEISGLSASELDAFKIGVYEGLRNKLGAQSGQTEIMNMWKNPSTQEKLRALFGSERSFRQFASDVAKEATLKKLQSVGTGSQTASRMAGMGDLDVSVLGDAGAAFGAAKTGNILGAVGSAKNAWNRVATPERVRDQMGSMLLQRGQDGRNLLGSISPLVNQINGRNMLLSNQVGILGSLTGGGLLD